MPVQNLPFIEGFAVTGQTDIALQLTDRTLKAQKYPRPVIYSLWDRVLQNSPTQTLSAPEINENLRQSGCKP